MPNDFRINAQVDLPGSVWEYGVSIGVIVLSFALIWRLIHLGLEKFEAISIQHATTLKELSDKHRVERSDWNDDARLREQRIVTVCDELIKAVHDKRNSTN